MSRIAIVAGCALSALSALLAPRAVEAQSPPAGGLTATITGVVRDSTRGVALSFAVVSVKTLGIQRFTSDSGSFALANLPAGQILLLVRRLGFSSREVRIELRPGERRTLSISLAPIAVTLNAVVVQTSSACDQPGPPRADGDSAFAAVFEQLRQNADQYIFLSASYPFASLFRRTLSYEQRDGSLEYQRDDSIITRTEHPWPYHPGGVVERAAGGSSSHYVMHVPTLDVFADSLFLMTHCFANAGVDQTTGRPLVRIDFRVAASITTPDVNGSMYLEPTTFQIRRSVVRLSRAPRELPHIDSAEVVTEFADVYPSVPVIISMRSRDRLNAPPNADLPVASIETHKLISLEWLNGRPGDAPSTIVAAVATLPTAPTRAALPSLSTLATLATPPIMATDPTESDVRPHSRAVLAVDSASGLPIPGVEVYQPATTKGGFTDVDGSVRVNEIPDSGLDVIIRKIGYAVRTIRLQTATGDTAAVRVPLTRSVELQAMVTKDSIRHFLAPGLRGFDERRKLHDGGYFISDSILRREEFRRLGDIMRSQMPSATVSDGAHSASYLLRSPRCSSGGPPQVYLDGVPLSAMPTDGKFIDPATPGARVSQSRAVPPFDLSQINVGNLAGVEYYPDDAMLPIGFNHTSDRCGALLLWTRER